MTRIVNEFRKGRQRYLGWRRYQAWVTIDDGKHLCSESLNCRRVVTSGLACSQVQGFMWQEDVVSVAKPIDECLTKVHVSAAGPFLHGQASISPMWLEEV